MSTALRISEAASIGMHALIMLAEHRGEAVSNREIAEAFNLSANHSSKVMQRLLKAGLVTAVRGPAGGYALAGDPEEVSLLDIYRTIDGQPDNSGCLFGGGRHCSLETCLFAGLISDTEKLLEKYLGSMTLKDFMDRDITLKIGEK